MPRRATRYQRGRVVGLPGERGGRPKFKEPGRWERGRETLEELERPAPDRFHAFDSLRAGMMLLGVVVHAGLSYSHTPPSALWPFRDARSSALCDAAMMISGLFRMPVFFLMAGFFAARMAAKRGTHGLVANRLRRIAVPFAVGWLVTFPLVRAGFACAEAMARGDRAPLASAVDDLRSGRALTDPGPVHLWFLEYLLIDYAAAIGLVHAASRLGPATRMWLDSGFRRLVASPCRTTWLAGLTAWPLLATPLGIIPAPESFWPSAVPLAAYGVSFAVGWGLFLQADLLPTLERHARRQLLLAIFLLPLAGTALWVRVRTLPPDAFGPLPPGAGDSLAVGELPVSLPSPEATLLMGLAAQAVLAYTGALIQWLLIFGVSGLAIRHLDRPIGWVRYLAGASYWIYLVHFPLMIWLPLVLSRFDLPAVVKLGLVLATGMGLMLGVYEVAVRKTPRGPRCVPLLSSSR